MVQVANPLCMMCRSVLHLRECVMGDGGGDEQGQAVEVDLHVAFAKQVP